MNRKVIRLSTVSWRGACTTSPSARISPWSFLSVRNARVAVSAKRTAVGSAHARDGHNARRRIDDEECPSRAEVLGRGVGKQRLKPRERAEVSGDRVGDRPLRRAARVRSQDRPEQRVIGVTAAMVAHSRADLLGHPARRPRRSSMSRSARCGYGASAAFRLSTYA